jgi:hypothetical protein
MCADVTVDVDQQAIHFLDQVLGHGQHSSSPHTVAKSWAPVEGALQDLMPIPGYEFGQTNQDAGERQSNSSSGQWNVSPTSISYDICSFDILHTKAKLTRVFFSRHR